MPLKSNPLTKEEQIELAQAKSTGKINDPAYAIQHLMRVKDVRGAPGGGDMAIKPIFSVHQAEMFRLIHSPDAPTQRHVILKARQVFMTTLMILMVLHRCATRPGVKAVFTAYSEDETINIFSERVDFICRHSPLMKLLRPDVFRTSVKFRENGSEFITSMSPRGQNPNFLHLSDYAKCCRFYPQKAREIRNGSLQASEHWPTIIESTSEGTGGHFHEIFSESWSRKLRGEPLNRVHFMPHFFAWGQKALNRVDPMTVDMTAAYRDYFDGVEEQIGEKIDDEQRAWYVSTLINSLGNDNVAMMQENPSTPDEAFRGSIEGKVLLRQVNKARQEARIDKFPRVESLPVLMFWDFGSTEYTAYIACQFQPLNDMLRVIDAHKEKDAQLKDLLGMIERKGLAPTLHVLPHDAQMENSMTQRHHTGNKPGVSIERAFGEFGWRNTKVVPRLSRKSQGFTASRQVFDRVCIDEGLEQLIEDLEIVGKLYDTKSDVYLEELEPNKDCNHFYDCFELAARALQEQPHLFQSADHSGFYYDRNRGPRLFETDGDNLLA